MVERGFYRNRKQIILDFLVHFIQALPKQPHVLLNITAKHVISHDGRIDPDRTVITRAWLHKVRRNSMPSVQFEGEI